MSESRRKVTFKLYPSRTQEALLLDMKGLHQRLYNAALEQRIDAYKRCGVSLPFSKQCKELTTLRRADPVYSSLNAQSCQVTLKRLELAFQSFFRRLKAGIKAGFPRFKSFRRFTGWGYKAHGDGFRVFSEGHHGTIRLSGIGTLKMRGKARQWGEVKTCEILHKQGDWYASVTLACTPERASGAEALGMDWGVETFATLVDEEGAVDKIENPRLLRSQLDKLAHEQRSLSRKKRGSKNGSRQLARVARLRGKIARRRKDFLHKESAKLVDRCALIATEELNVKTMTASGGGYKKGWNREILSTAPSTFLSMIRYKAEEAGIAYHEVETRKVKPSQTCPSCGRRQKKRWSQRVHQCPCGSKMGRDAASAKVMLHQALYGRPTGREPSRCGDRQLCLL